MGRLPGKAGRGMVQGGTLQFCLLFLGAIYIYIYTWDIHEMYVVVISMNYNMELQSDVSARAPSFLE